MGNDRDDFTSRLYILMLGCLVLQFEDCGALESAALWTAAMGDSRLPQVKVRFGWGGQEMKSVFRDGDGFVAIFAVKNPWDFERGFDDRFQRPGSLFGGRVLEKLEQIE